MDCDDADRGYLASLIPDDAMPVALISVVSWIDSDGSQRWRVHIDADVPVSSVVGLLEIAKLDALARSDTGLPFTYEAD